MVMIDVRNAIANILDRYTVAQVVDVTLRKMRRDGIVPPFATSESAATIGTATAGKADPADGFLAGLSQLTHPIRDPHETAQP
jgi:hypothetical protein